MEANLLTVLRLRMDNDRLELAMVSPAFAWRDMLRHACRSRIAYCTRPMEPKKSQSALDNPALATLVLLSDMCRSVSAL